jgi:hypothetical protein
MAGVTLFVFISILNIRNEGAVILWKHQSVSLREKKEAFFGFFQNSVQATVAGLPQTYFISRECPIRWTNLNSY